jgi:hypothetical protein
MIDEKSQCEWIVTKGSSPCLRPAYGIDNKGFSIIIDMNRILRNILETNRPRRRNPAHGCLWYRSLARSARISRIRSGHPPQEAGGASPTARERDRTSAMPNVLFPSPGWWARIITLPQLSLSMTILVSCFWFDIENFIWSSVSNCPVVIIPGHHPLFDLRYHF